MDPVVILLALGALLVVGFLLFSMFRRWGTMPTPTITPPPQVPAELANDYEIRRFLAQGNKIQAIKRVRELTGLGLKESKDYVDQLPIGAPLEYGAAEPVAAESLRFVPDPAFEQEIRQLLTQRQKIEAIKRVRELTGMGLKESKDYVDALERQR
ncbi:MAG TPA: ribosomal protein L7/L12 [Herpetosiphonaceae bacterium]